MTLDQTRPGQEFTILSVDDEFARLQAIRFGMAEGARAVCQAILPGGPVVVRKGKQEMAIGRNLAVRIRVRPMGV